MTKKTLPSMAQSNKMTKVSNPTAITREFPEIPSNKSSHSCEYEMYTFVVFESISTACSGSGI